jgi:hypothetical protein
MVTLNRQQEFLFPCKATFPKKGNARIFIG